MIKRSKTNTRNSVVPTNTGACPEPIQASRRELLAK